MTQIMTPAAAPQSPTPAAPLRKAPKSRDGYLRTPGWLYAVMAGGLVVVIIPFICMVVSSFKPEAEVRSVPPTWWPETVTTENYQQLFTQLDFPTVSMDSAIVASAAAPAALVSWSTPR